MVNCELARKGSQPGSDMWPFLYLAMASHMATPIFRGLGVLSSQGKAECV